MSFQVHAKDLLGRVGTIRTRSGVFDTPHMFPVLDPYHQVLDQKFFDGAKIGAVMTNAYLLKRGQRSSEIPDVHTTLGFNKSVATDSGAYQILEYGGVQVKPAEIVEYQEKIGSDIGVILDVPTGFRSDPSRARWTVDETVRRADAALESMTREDILWMGPVQGGVHLREVERSAREMSKRDFPIYALGSPTELMESQRYDILAEMVVAAKSNLPKGKPLHLFGAGHPVLFPFLVALGCDLFDSAAYALYARVGRYLTSEGTQLLGDMVEFACSCPACADLSPSEVLNSDPKQRESRLIQHNLWACFSELRRIREAIRRGRLWELLESRARVHPALMDCFARIRNHAELLESSTPVVKPHGIFHLSASSEDRPEALRYRAKLVRSTDERGKTVLVLPGRWRRPFHEDPRYQVVANSFDDHRNVSICYYSPSWGPVPIELDETFPIAQAEGRDLGDPDLYRSKAEDVARFVKTLRPKSVILVSHSDFGRSVTAEMRKTLGRRKLVVLEGETLKPQAIIKSVERRIATDP
jgi:7-cyano-7-deazaguanine tRNA-ribosyltransferase